MEGEPLGLDGTRESSGAGSVLWIAGSKAKNGTACVGMVGVDYWDRTRGVVGGGRLGWGKGWEEMEGEEREDGWSDWRVKSMERGKGRMRVSEAWV